MATIKTSQLIHTCLALCMAFGTQTTYAERANADVSTGANAKVILNTGDTPPAISLGLTRRGEEISIDQYKGSVTVLTFWASWCAPCRQEMVMLNRLAEVMPDKLKVVSVNIEDREKFKAVTRQMVHSKVAMTNDPSKRAASAYGVNGIPHMVIFDKEGKVVSVKRGYSEESLPGMLNEIEREIEKR